MVSAIDTVQLHSGTFYYRAGSCAHTLVTLVAHGTLVTKSMLVLYVMLTPISRRRRNRSKLCTTGRPIRSFPKQNRTLAPSFPFETKRRVKLIKKIRIWIDLRNRLVIGHFGFGFLHVVEVELPEVDVEYFDERSLKKLYSKRTKIRIAILALVKTRLATYFFDSVVVPAFELQKGIFSERSN